MDNREIRRACGWSIAKTAVVAGVGAGLVRIFEIDPREVQDETKREALVAVYAALRVCLGSDSGSYRSAA